MRSPGGISRFRMIPRPLTWVFPRDEKEYSSLWRFSDSRRQGGSERPGPTGRYVPAASRIIESYRGHDSPALAKLEASEKAARGWSVGHRRRAEETPSSGTRPRLAGGVGGGECRPRTPRGKRTAKRGLPISPGRRPPDPAERLVPRPMLLRSPLPDRGCRARRAASACAAVPSRALLLSLRAEQERVTRRRTIAPAETDGPIICDDRGRLSASYSVK